MALVSSAIRCFAGLRVYSHKCNQIGRIRVKSSYTASDMASYREQHVNKIFDDIQKSAEDKRLYRGLELKNRMKVLLISDPTTDKSAASLTVNIGFLSDPDSVPGLAHFCEHMLFLGTEKYPEENVYNKFLSEHGGSSNACTSTDHTYYFFDVAPEHLTGALDIFSQFFISPLFTPDCTGRELLAVNSEHDKNVLNDLWRIDQLNRVTSDLKHPHSKFGTGNKETLETIPKQMGIDVHKELLKFHTKYYSSNIMSLALFGKESLDELENITIEKFSSIVDSNVELPRWDSPYLPEHLGIKINMVPIKDIRYLHIDFPIPETKKHYKSGPGHYISHLLGHEGPGSLLSLLKAKGWCNSLSCGPQDSGPGYALFDISVDLTETGMEHIDGIIELVFQYINLLKSDGIQKWIFDETSTISATSFRFKDKEDPRGYVTSNANAMQHYPMEEILTAHYHLTDWNPDLIKTFLSKLTPQNIRIGVIAKKLEPMCNLSEKWYGTKYSIEKIPAETIEKWENCGLCPELVLPPPNEFLPESFDIAVVDPVYTDHPKIIKDTPLMRLWYKQDNEYLLPKLNCFFDFVSPLAYSDPLNTCLNAIFSMLYQDDLNEFAYAAEIAGLSYNTRNARNGLMIRIDGFDSKHHVLLEIFMNKLFSFKVNPDRFKILKEIYVRELQNFDMQQPYQHGIFYLSLMLTEHAWSKKEFLEVIDAITIQNLEEYISSFLSRLHIECFIHGNASKSKALEITSIVEDRLPKNIIPLLQQQLILAREIELEKGSHYRLEIDHKIHNDSCALMFYQCGLESTTLNVVLELLLQILSEPCFNILRTKEQLGYMVFSGIRCNNGARGIRIIVQSEKHPVYVESRIEAFLCYMEKYINEMSDKEFENHKQSLINQKLKRPKQLLGLSYVLKSEIASQQYHFDRVNVEVNGIKQVTKQQILDFYLEKLAITSPQRQKLGVHVISSAEGGAGNPNSASNKSEKRDLNVDYLPAPNDPSTIVVIDNATSFKSGRSLFPLVAPYINIPRKGAHCKL